MYHPSLQESYFICKKFKPLTEKQYRRNIEFLKTTLGYKTDTHDFQWINRIRLFKQRIIKTKYAPNTIRSMLQTWRSVAYWLEDCFIQDYKRIEISQELERYDGMLRESRAKNESSAPLTTMNELRGVLDVLQDVYDDYPMRETYHDLLTVALYTLRPPCRLDYADMVVVRGVPLEDEKPEGNYLVLTDDWFYFVLRKYKTEKRYGDYQSPTYLSSSRLYRIVRHWCDTYVRFGAAPPLEDVDPKTGSFMGPQETRNALGVRIKRIFHTRIGKDITLNTIRRTYESELIQSPEYSTMTLEEKKQLHAELQHSFFTAQEYNIVKPPDAVEIVST